MVLRFRNIVFGVWYLSLFGVITLLAACSDISDDLISPPAVSSDSAVVSDFATPASSVSVAVESPHQIGVLLPLQGDLSNAAKAIQAGFNDAYQQSSLKPVIKLYDTSQGEDIDVLYDKAVHEGANYIVGPLDKTQVAALENHSHINTLTIALNNPDKSVYHPNLYEFALSPTEEAKQIADKASQKGYSKALLITPAGTWGQNISNALQQRWQEDGGTVVASQSIDGRVALKPQITQEIQQTNTDVIFLIVQPILARQIKALLNSEGMENIPVYGTSLIYTGLMNAETDQDLNNIVFCDMPLMIDPQGPWASLRQQVRVTQPENIQRYIRLYGLGYDAALLTQHFIRLNQGISGSTGFLTSDAHHDILRKLDFAIFKNGLPQQTDI